MITKKEPNSTKSKIKKATRIAFTLAAPEAQSVFLVGDFNNWDETSHPLKKNSDGTWKINISLTPGRYEYRLLVDGAWQNDPKCMSFTPNPFGQENCILVVEEG
jgi:1,4-alpha-glucan branching enzyme